MRCLERNKRKFYYAPLIPEESEPIVDEYGNETGESIPKYGAKVEMRANISAANGSVAREWYGIADQYDRSIIISGECPFDETAGLWIDDLDAQRPDYAVKGIATSLNGTIVVTRKLV